jgi:hypothetical protein
VLRRKSGAPSLRDLAFRDPGDASCAAGVQHAARTPVLRSISSHASSTGDRKNSRDLIYM